MQTESPRGRILDRNGTVLVENVAEWAVTVDRQLAKSTRTRVIGQLAEVLAPQYTAEQLESNFNDLRQTPLKPAIVAVGVPEPARIAILEHIEDYPGTNVEKLTVRHYPHGELAAHVLGYTGEISEAQLASRRAAGYQEGDTIGKDGAERAFEKDLRGQPRREKVEVDPTGQPVGNPLDVQPGTIGDDVALTIDANWQYAAETALAQGIASARDQQNANIKNKRFEKLKAPGGAVVAMDVTDGSIVAMASFPNYDVSSFVDGISQSEWKTLNDNPDHPLVDRATQGVYAPGSTFKLVSSIAMTQYGIRGPNDTVLDKGTVTLGKDKRVFHNAGQRRARSRVSCQSAITRSSDVYFYTAGDGFWQAWNAGDKDRGLGLQTTAHEFGFGAPTGVELDEADGHGARPRVEAGPRRQDLAHRDAEEGERRVVSRRRHLHRGRSGRVGRHAVAARECLRRVRERWHAVEAARRARREGHERQRRADLHAAGDPPDPDGRERARQDARRVRRCHRGSEGHRLRARGRASTLERDPGVGQDRYRAGRREGRGQG